MVRAATLLIACIVGAALVCPAQSSDINMSEGRHFEIMPYFLVPGMSGTASVKGTRQEINASAGDIFSNLQFGFMGRTRLSYNRLFVGTDTLYMGLGGANSNVDAGFDQWAAELLGGYRVRQNITLLSGARYNSLSANLQFKGPLGANPRAAQVWWDPFFGGEGAIPLTKKVGISTRFDIGGFGAGSRFAANAEPLLNYQFNDRCKANFGWKFFYQDYVNNSQAFEYDVLTQGPVLGLTMRW